MRINARSKGIRFADTGGNGIATINATGNFHAIGSVTGTIVQGTSTLASSGTLVVEGAAAFGSTLTLNGVTYTFPASDGSNKDFLQTAGNGTLSWASLLGIEDLSDPNADRIFFWDDSAGAAKFLTVGSNLSVSDTTISATDSDTTYTAGNGLTLSSTTFKFGGTLTEATTVTQAGYDMIFDMTSTGNFEVRDNGSTFLFGDDTGKLGIGTATPTTELEVVGTMSGDVLAVGGGQTSIAANGTAIFNDNGNAINFRIESDTDANTFFVHGTNDDVGIGTSTPDARLEVIGTISGATV